MNLVSEVINITDKKESKHVTYHKRIAEHYDLPDAKAGSNVKMLYFSLKNLVAVKGEKETNELINTLLGKIKNDESLIPRLDVKKED